MPVEYTVVLQPDLHGGYVGVVAAFPGCYTQGATALAALANVRKAIELTIEDMRSRGERIPDPAGDVFERVVVGP